MRLGYIDDRDVAGENEAFFSFSDLIGSKYPEFIFLEQGDLVLSLLQERHDISARWTPCRVFEVAILEETGDSFDYTLRALHTIEPTSGRFSWREVVDALSWLPSPTHYFKALPFAAWEWLREQKGVQLPIASHRPVRPDVGDEELE